ncbi:AAA family ATPase [Candidatus Methylospira mobilis]|uniref:AAA family ATPase n=1 Tax=Candidatus Methylospira mobilis TaxID=1808979 RepID=A0A5Q0BIT7_9GAMM|nr:ParA family partition ATPase [Candidatus Methylospira mobilis]QFY42077.1 AAA family ATPase [Candidatus Methylospira mobilis]WNV03084.1 ParA family partition ATPase [Candidatus Methylospira mobilis]
MIISVLNQKGGVGKTTLSVNIATALALGSNKVLLVDADTQGSALDWHSSRVQEALFPVVGLAKPTLHKDIPELAGPYDHVIIDGPPRANDVARSAIMASHIVLIPLQPSPYDVWAADEIVKLIQEALVFRENIKALFIVNRKIANTAIGRDVSSALAGYPFALTQSIVGQRVAFAESAAQGLSVLEFEPKGAAAKEIKSLVHEIMEF